MGTGTYVDSPNAFDHVFPRVEVLNDNDALPIRTSQSTGLFYTAPARCGVVCDDIVAE